jgi:hypothetical protein
MDGLIVNCVPQGLVMDANGRLLTPKEAQQWAHDLIYGSYSYVPLPAGTKCR